MPICLVSQNENLARELTMFDLRVVKSISEIPDTIFISAIIFDEHFNFNDIIIIRRKHPQSFLSIFYPLASEIPLIRLQLFDVGINQVAHDIETLIITLKEDVLFEIPSSSYEPLYSCPYCKLNNLSEDQLWKHCPAYHINTNENNISNICPICQKELSTRDPLQVFLIFF